MRQKYISEWNDTAGKIKSKIDEMRLNSHGEFTTDELRKISDWSSAADFYITEMQGIIKKVTASNNAGQTSEGAQPLSSAEVNTMIGKGKDRLSQVLIKGVAEMSKAKSAEILTLPEIAASGFQQLLLAVLLSVVVGILIALFLILTLPKLVMRPIQALTTQVDSISRGNFQTEIDHKKTVKEFDNLVQAIGRMSMAQQMLLDRLRRQKS